MDEKDEEQLCHCGAVAKYIEYVKTRNPLQNRYLCEVHKEQARKEHSGGVQHINKIKRDE